MWISNSSNLKLLCPHTILLAQPHFSEDARCLQLPLCAECRYSRNHFAGTASAPVDHQRVSQSCKIVLWWKARTSMGASCCASPWVEHRSSVTTEPAQSALLHITKEATSSYITQRWEPRTCMGALYSALGNAYMFWCHTASTVSGLQLRSPLFRLSGRRPHSVRKGR